MFEDTACLSTGLCMVVKPRDHLGFVEGRYKFKFLPPTRETTQLELEVVAYNHSTREYKQRAF